MNPKRILHLYDVINNASVPQILEAIIRFNNDDDLAQQETMGEFGTFTRDPIHLHINSGGGIVYDSLTLVSVIESSITPIYTYCHGYAMSAAIPPFVAGHIRYAGKYSTFMVHQPSEPIGDEKLFVIENRIEETKRAMKVRTDYIISKTNLKQEDFNRNKHIDWFMNAELAKFNGIVDEII